MFSSWKLGPCPSYFTTNLFISKHSVTNIFLLVHLVAMLMVSLFLAVSGIILYPHGYILSAILSFLISFLIFGSLVILATSIIARKNGVPFNRLKLRQSKFKFKLKFKDVKLLFKYAMKQNLINIKNPKNYIISLISLDNKY